MENKPRVRVSITNNELNKILPYTAIFFFCSLLLGIFLNTTSLIILFTFSVLGSWKSNSIPPLNNKLLWLIIIFVFYEIAIIFTFNTDIKASLSELFTFVPLLLIVISFFLNSKKLNSNLFRVYSQTKPIKKPPF